MIAILMRQNLLSRLMGQSWRKSGILAVGLALVLEWPSVAQVTEFYLSTIQVFLGPRQRSALLTVTNSGDTPLEFEISTEKWQQDAEGRDQLSPTDGELIVFPLVLSVPVGESRNIRIGTRQPPAITESTYRLFVAELPPANVPTPPDSGSQIRIVKRLSLPVFIEPRQPERKGEFLNPTVEKGQLSFTLRNTGNVHIQTSTIVLTGLNSTQDILFEKNLDSVYRACLTSSKGWLTVLKPS